MKLIPTLDRVLVLPEPKQENRTKGGLYIPESSVEQDKIIYGNVVAVGKGRFDDKGQRIPVEYKEGQKVGYHHYSGHDVKVEETEYLLIEAEKILLIVEE